MMTVSDSVEPLILDLLEWIGPQSRPYAEVLEAWRTSCPRLPVWEEARARGFIVGIQEAGRGLCIRVSTAGRQHLRKHGRVVSQILPARRLHDIPSMGH